MQYHFQYTVLYLIILKGPTCPDLIGPRMVSLIHWIGLGKEIPCYRFLIFYIDLEILNGVQNSRAQIYLITNSFRGRQASGGSCADFVGCSALQ